MKTPIEVLQSAIARSIWVDKYSRFNHNRKPGEVILDMSREDREILKKLRSEDLSKIRPDIAC